MKITQLVDDLPDPPIKTKYKTMKVWFVHSVLRVIG